VPPPFFRYGVFGVAKVEGGQETVLLKAPVRWAWSDGSGGLVFRYDWFFDDALSRELYHLPSGASEPVVYPLDGYGYSVINLDGRAAVLGITDVGDLYAGYGCPHSIVVHDLETGVREDFAACAGEGDYGQSPNSYGGGLYVGVGWADSSSCRTISGISFWDDSGSEVDVAVNPYPQLLGWEVHDPAIDWIPCEIDARLSPDGRLLAYRFRPDNKWPCPEYDDILYEDWLEESRKIPGEVVVLNIETGSVVYKASSEAEERLADFDGRYLVLTTTDRRWDVPIEERDPVAVSTIVDVTGTNPDHTVDGQVRLIWTKV
jgi:hypothetical protein